MILPNVYWTNTRTGIYLPWIGEWCKDKPYAKLKDPQKVKKDAPYGNFGDEYAKDSRRHYYANVTFIDEEIGKVIKTLKEKGIYDDALICYISDHGDMLGRPLSLA